MTLWAHVNEAADSSNQCYSITDMNAKSGSKEIYALLRENGDKSELYYCFANCMNAKKN
ncbi:MAG: hypothetical protein PUD20_03645 [bacterium]|nr:hypothetical protein [bacterium]